MPDPSQQLICPAKTPGTTGVNDQGDPNNYSFLGTTPGPLGQTDAAELMCSAPRQTSRPRDNSPSIGSASGGLSEETVSGSISILARGGIVSVVRVPVPGSNGLFVELKPRGYVPPSGSTSTLFIQDNTGNKHLRLDYGYNKTTGTVDYHWNQQGTHPQFGITNHQPAGKPGRLLHKGAKYLRYGGKVLIVVGLTADMYSVVVARKKVRQVVKVAAGWGGAWAGCKLIGAAGAAGGTAYPGVGTAAGGVTGCVIGAVAGGAGASWAAGEVYDTVEEYVYEELPEAAN